MEDETSSDLQKLLNTESSMDAEENTLINENSNGLMHMMGEGDYISGDASGVDESSVSNHGFLNAAELGSSVDGYNENITHTLNSDSFGVGDTDNAVNFPNDSINNVLSDGDSRLSDSVFRMEPSDTEADLTDSLKHQNNIEIASESNDTSMSAIDISQNNCEKSEAEDLNNDNSVSNFDTFEVSLAKEDSNMKMGNDIEDSVDIKKENMIKSNANDTIEEKKVAANHEKKKVGSAEETEVVSEDELPTVQKPSVKDAENVSDDELPGPKPADLPADTEVVSEDELPSSKKEVKENRKRKTEEAKDGYDPGSPTSETETINKKQAVTKNGESKPVPAEKRPSTEEKQKKKALPELEKYWKVVNEDPTDFTGWTYLLQYVDQESEVDAAREAYDAFLSHYPYCYGYWRKYADYEKKKGSKKKCLEVLERGLKAIPLSVDLWIHYLNHIKTTRTDDHSYIRSQYERAIDACGLEFRSDRLWESYIKWESEHGNPLNVTNVYDRLLATPTLGYTQHFDNFQEHVMSSSVSNAVSIEEVVRLRDEVRAGSSGPPPPSLDLPPGEDEPSDHIASDEEAQAIKERIIAARRKIHKITGEDVAARWAFEEGIKRPYFHVKPLERSQLKNWKAYLEWEKQNGSFKRALVLHERCLIATALYDDFWIRLVKFLEERADEDPSLVAVEREVLERACTVHHLDKPELHLHWAHFEEAQGNVAKAAEILDRIEKTCPNLVNIQYRRVNLERRRGDYEKCTQLYESYIQSSKSKSIASALAIKCARFLFHVKKDQAAARKVLDEAVNRDPLNSRLHMQRLDLALHTSGTPYEELEELCMSYEKQEGCEPEVASALAWRRRELAEELGDAAAARAAAKHARHAHRQLRKRTRPPKHDRPASAQPPSSADSKKKESSSGTSTPLAAAAGNSAYYQPPPQQQQQSYEQSYAQSYQPPWGYQQPPGPYQHYPGQWPQHPNYY